MAVGNILISLWIYPCLYLFFNLAVIVLGVSRKQYSSVSSVSILSSASSMSIKQCKQYRQYRQCRRCKNFHPSLIVLGFKTRWMFVSAPPCFSWCGLGLSVIPPNEPNHWDWKQQSGEKTGKIIVIELENISKNKNLHDERNYQPNLLDWKQQMKN